MKSHEWIVIHDQLRPHLVELCKWSTTKSKLLVERLEALVFECMQNPKDPLFSNELLKLIKESKKGETKDAWTRKTHEIFMKSII